MSEALIKAVRSLISDIEGMRGPCGSDLEWFGPFSEYETGDDGMMSVNVEWPNLAISLEAVKKELPR